MRFKIDLKIFVFIILFYITRQIEFYSMIMIFCMFHEIGHLLAGVIVGMKPEEIKIMPFGFSVSFKTDIEGYNCKIGKANLITLKKIIVAIAGPITNVILMISFYFLNISIYYKQMIMFSNLLIILFNLITIYPLDGGRILKGILHIFLGIKKAKIYINEISIISCIIVTIMSSIAIYYFQNIAILLIDIYLWFLTLNEYRKFKINMDLYDNIERLSISVDEKGFTNV